MNKSASAKAVLCASLAWPMFAAPALAQENGDGAEEIVVTANRRAESILEVPMSVTALQGDDLNQRGLTQIESFASQVPGLSIENQGRIGLRLILRGQNTGGSVGGAAVANTLDEIVLTSGSALSRGALVTSNLDLFDMERIEVLRGPQGTLYGANALGGLLKYVSNAPDLNAFGGAWEVGAESVRDGETGYSVKGAVNVPLAQDVAALRLTGYFNDAAGYVDNPQLGLSDVNGGELFGGRAQLLLEPNASLSIRFTAGFQEDSYGSEGVTQLVGAPAVSDTETDASFDLFSGEPVENLLFAGEVEGEFQYYNGLVDYDFGGLTLTSSTSFVDGARSFFVDASNGPAAPGLTLAQALGPFFGEPIVAIVDQENSFEKLSQEFRLAFDNEGALRWQVGLFYSTEDVVFDQNFETRSAADISQPVTVFGLSLGGRLTEADYEELSGFGEATVSFTDRFDLSFGGRYTTIDQSAVFQTFAGLFTGPTDVTNPTIDSSEEKFTYSLAPRFELSDDVSLYGRVATGFRPGGPLTTPGAGTLFPASFKPDELINYEIGIKGRGIDGRLSYDIALFQIDWTDIQIVGAYFNPDTNQTFFVTGNAGEAQSRGVEWAFGLNVTDNLELSWSGALTNAELGTDAPGLGGSEGDSLPYVPEVSSALNIDYTTPLGPYVGNLGLTWNHVGERYGEFSTTPALSNNPRIPAYDTIDLRAGIDFDRFRIDGLIRNVSDERGIVLYRSSGGFDATSGSGVIVQPRTFVLRASAEF